MRKLAIEDVFWEKRGKTSDAGRQAEKKGMESKNYDLCRPLKLRGLPEVLREMQRKKQMFYGKSFA